MLSLGFAYSDGASWARGREINVNRLERCWRKVRFQRVARFRGNEDNVGNIGASQLVDGPAKDHDLALEGDEVHTGFCRGVPEEKVAAPRADFKFRGRNSAEQARVIKGLLQFRGSVRNPFVLIGSMVVMRGPGFPHHLRQRSLGSTPSAEL